MRFALIVVLVAASVSTLGCRGGRSRGGYVPAGSPDEAGEPGTRSGSGALTNGEVCDITIPALCEWEARCGFAEGTMADCVSAGRYDCCSGESCTWLAEGDRAQADACAASIRSLSCEGTDLGSACDGLFGSGPDAGVVITPDAGTAPSAGLYESCDEVPMCNAEAEACFYVYGPDGFDASYMCTRRCDGASDTITCGAGAICAPQYGDNPAVCLRSCAGDTDCPIEFRCRVFDAGTSYVRGCAP